MKTFIVFIKERKVGEAKANSTFEAIAKVTGSKDTKHSWAMSV